MSGQALLPVPLLRKRAAPSNGAANRPTMSGQQTEILAVQGEIAEGKIDAAQNGVGGEKSGQRRQPLNTTRAGQIVVPAELLQAEAGAQQQENEQRQQMQIECTLRGKAGK